MIKYKKYQNRNEESRAYKKWFGRAVHELMEFDEFVEHMANHHCVYSEGTIRGVLIEMEICLRELLLEGKAVRFDDASTTPLTIISMAVEYCIHSFWFDVISCEFEPIGCLIFHCKYNTCAREHLGHEKTAATLTGSSG